MPNLNPVHLDELTKLSVANARAIVRLRRLFRAVLLPVCLTAWLGLLLTLKYILQNVEI